MGSLYNIVLISITLIYFSIDSPSTKLYDIEFKIRMLSIYSVIFFFAYFFESIRAFTFSAFQRMQEKNVEYNRKILEKNRDLKNKNEELLMLTEEVRVQMDYLKDLNVVLEDKNKKIVSQNIQLEQQSNEISDQRDLLLIQKQNITDSILYASYIQKALLPTEDILKENFSDYLIFYKPRDIIGGDFYYVKKIQNNIVLAVADCTGHGVPGALLSMLGISYLNEIIHTNELSETNAILNEMRNKIKLALHQSNQPRETKDGMDMALISIDKKNNLLKFSGANNTVYIVRDSELYELKADRMTLGIQPNERPTFTNLEFQLCKNDCVYLFSDGYPDQLDGLTKKKYSLKNFQSLLIRVSGQKMNEQTNEMEREIENWRKNADQTDDILVVGVRI
jgi:serine phosphatase RsbU (regulator of sigma subunit)